MTTSEKIKTIRRDFLSRDEGTFVSIRKKGRLGWEKLIPEGGTYSDLFRDLTSNEDIIIQAYKMASDFIVAMDTPHKVKLQLGTTESCTDSKNVFIATGMFDDTDLSTGQKVDTFIGLAVHEGCHLKYTDFEAGAHESNKVIRDLMNIIEDERIEHQCGEDMPGYANFLVSTKYYYFGRYQDGIKESRLPESCLLMNAILKMIRYPKALSDGEVERFCEPLYKIRLLLEDFPKDNEGVTRLSYAIWEVIKDFFKDSGESEGSGSEDGKEGEESSARGGRGDGTDESGKDEESEKSDKGDKGDKGDGTSRPSDSAGSEEGEGEGGSPAPEPEGSASEGSEGEGEDGSGKARRKKKSPAGHSSKPRSEDELMRELEKILESIHTSGIAGTPSGRLSEICGEVRDKGELLAKICEGTAERINEKAYCIKARNNESCYRTHVANIRKYVPAIRKAIMGHTKEYQVVHKGVRNGLLDTGKLAEAYQGVQNVYVTTGRVKSSKMAVGILVDESGSMIREGRIQAARDAVALLNEAIKDIPGIDLYIYGHTADVGVNPGTLQLNIYREKGYAPLYACGSIDALDNNRDGDAILQTAKRIKNLSQQGGLLFVISDGAPAAQEYIGRMAIEDTRLKVLQAEKLGFMIIQICINASYDPALMFKNYMKFEDLPHLAPTLAKLIKKNLLKHISKTEI